MCTRWSCEVEANRVEIRRLLPSGVQPRHDADRTFWYWLSRSKIAAGISGTPSTWIAAGLRGSPCASRRNSRIEAGFMQERYLRKLPASSFELPARLGP